MERLWSFSELKFVQACTRGMADEQVAEELNARFHGGSGVRTTMDVAAIRKKKTIFAFEDERKSSGSFI
jgi:hypothetical protein